MDKTPALETTTTDRTVSEHPLELSTEQMVQLVDEAMAHIAAHITALPVQDMSYTEGGEELARAHVEDLPEQGAPYRELLHLIFDKLVSKTYNCASPGYLAYIPGGGLFHAAVADLISNSLNRYTGVFIAAPGLIQLEINVARWFCQMVGYPDVSQGLLTSGGSMANFTAIVTARRERLPDDFLRGTLYCSDQVHHSVTKAALLAGFPADNIRSVPSDEHQRICLDRLREQVAADHRSGFEPFLIVGSAGTVNTGAVDDLSGLADVAEENDLWLHVDGAYGGFFVLTDRGRDRLRGLSRADSITLDPHKGLFLPYGTGALVVRDGAALKRTHHVAADYMPQTQDDPDLVDFSEISPELSRDFRGLRIWLPLKLHGADVFRQTLDEKLDLASWACEELKRIDDIVVITEPQLSIVTFRLHPDGMEESDLTELNMRLRDQINAKQRVFLTPTTLDGRYVIRICVLNFRTHVDRMEMCLEDIRASVREVLEAWRL